MPLPAPVMTAILSGVAIFRFPYQLLSLKTEPASATTSSSCAATSANSPLAGRSVASITPQIAAMVSGERLGQRLAFEQPAEKERGDGIAAAGRLDRQARGFDRPDAVRAGGDARRPGQSASSRLVTSTMPGPRSRSPAAAAAASARVATGRAGQPFELEAVRRDDVGHSDRMVAVEFRDAGADIPAGPDIAHDRVAGKQCPRVRLLDPADDVEQHRAGVGVAQIAGQHRVAARQYPQFGDALEQDPRSPAPGRRRRAISRSRCGSRTRPC